jgi:hypothetical protein
LGTFNWGAVNASRGRWENLWSSEKTSVIPLGSTNDVLGKMVYTLANPVQAQLVPKGSNWPGVWLFRSCHSQTVRRPDVYFRKDGDMPDQINLTIAPPPHLSYHSQEAYEGLVEEKLFRREQKIAAKMAAKGREFFGVRAIMKQHPTASPKNREPRREPPRRRKEQVVAHRRNSAQ